MGISGRLPPIDPTELKLLKARKCPNALAARAIIRSGTGHKYWSKFAIDQQHLIQELAKEINANLFIPLMIQLTRRPVPTSMVLRL
jgi:hypothetical protein